MDPTFLRMERAKLEAGGGTKGEDQRHDLSLSLHADKQRWDVEVLILVRR